MDLHTGAIHRDFVSRWPAKLLGPSTLQKARKLNVRGHQVVEIAGFA